jgi:hypothetical protein
MKKKTKANGTGRPVIVTTAHRGVFFGYADKTNGDVIRLHRSRLCVYWSVDVRGFMGLASNGPTAKCRIGPPAEIELRNITAVLEGHTRRGQEVGVGPMAVIRGAVPAWALSGYGYGYGDGSGYGDDVSVLS